MMVMPVFTVKGPAFGMRYRQTLLLFFGVVVAHIGRNNISVAVVAMTNAETTNPNFQEFDWDEKQKSYILSSFFWGYCVTQFLGGYLSKRIGAKYTMLISIGGSAVASLLIPALVPLGGWQIFCAIRVVQGLFQGLLFPCVHEHLAKWSPIHERNRLGAFANSGVAFGTVLAMGVSGVVAASTMGWPGISYLSGGSGFIWAILWIYFAANRPEKCKNISSEELTYIETSQDNQTGRVKKIPTPWRAMMTSLPFIALVIVRSCEDWGFSTMQNEIPSYLNGVLLMDIKSNALFSALPYLVMWIMSYVYLISADVIMKKEWLSLCALRKTFNSIAFFIPAAAFIAVGYVSADQKPLAIALITINVGVNSAATIGSALNTIDLAPNHAGMQMGVINTVSNFVQILTPLLVGVVVTDDSNRSQWRIVFIISAIVFIAGNLFYITFGSTQLQPWNEPNFLTNKTDTERQEKQIEPKVATIAAKDMSLSSNESPATNRCCNCGNIDCALNAARPDADSYKY